MPNFEIPQSNPKIETKNKPEKLEAPEETKEIEAQKEELSGNLKGLEEDLKQFDLKKVSSLEVALSIMKDIREAAKKSVEAVAGSAVAAGMILIVTDNSIESVMAAVSAMPNAPEKEVVMTLMVLREAIKLLGL